MVDDEGSQRPVQAAAGDLRPRLRGRAQIVSPVAAAGVATVAADTDEQSRRPGPERLVREPARACAKRATSATAPMTVTVDIGGAAFKRGSVGVEVQSRDRQTQDIKVAESREIGRAEGSVEQVEVLQMVSVRTSILEDLDLFPRRPARTTALQPHLRRADNPSERLRSVNSYDEKRKSTTFRSRITSKRQRRWGQCLHYRGSLARSRPGEGPAPDGEALSDSLCYYFLITISPLPQGAG